MELLGSSPWNIATDEAEAVQDGGADLKKRRSGSLSLAMLVVVALSCVSSSPSAATMKLYKLMEAGEIEEALEFFSQNTRSSTGDDKLRAVLRQGTREIDEKDGIKSFEVTSEKEIGEIAEVHVEIVYGNGSKETEKLNLVKEDGKWKLAPSK